MSAVGPALFARTTGNVNKGASGEVTKFPNDVQVSRGKGQLPGMTGYMTGS